jgi:hypothetical protein
MFEIPGYLIEMKLKYYNSENQALSNRFHGSITGLFQSIFLDGILHKKQGINYDPNQDYLSTNTLILSFSCLYLIQ